MNKSTTKTNQKKGTKKSLIGQGLIQIRTMMLKKGWEIRTDCVVGKKGSFKPLKCQDLRSLHSEDDRKKCCGKPSVLVGIKKGGWKLAVCANHEKYGGDCTFWHKWRYKKEDPFNV